MTLMILQKINHVKLYILQRTPLVICFETQHTKTMRRHHCPSNPLAESSQQTAEMGTKEKAIK
jgi:hypothetical protein